ncbi:MAG: carboxypeptidase regulatory-like domain-containing protein [Bacteroidetes bacterium]|nr:MAG: carboxypeptidase regulatory-like domain-containing protein [Bacteroidota bacterium]
MTWDTLIERMTLDCTPAKLITVEEGMITQGIDFRLLSANRVTGRITDAADGTPLAGIHVCTSIPPPYWPSSSSEAYTDPNGRYSLFIPGSLDSANYTINADDWSRMVYTDASYPYPVELRAGMEVNGINMAMEEGARVTGRVTYAGTNAPAEGAFVECLVPDSPSSTRPKAIHSVRTDTGGNYCMAGIPEGGYVIYAMSGDFRHEGYYRDNRDCLDPPVMCESGRETAGIDIRLKPIERPKEGAIEEDGTY